MKIDEEDDDRPFFFPNPDGKYTHPLTQIHIYIHNTHTHTPFND
jgi:hypothetical protein